MLVLLPCQPHSSACRRVTLALRRGEMQIITLVLIFVAPLVVCGLSATVHRHAEGQSSSGGEAVSTPFLL
eukprot:873985-Amphidinium_carterae.2